MFSHEILSAELVESPSFAARGQMIAMLEIDVGAPLVVDAPADDVEVVEATDAEWEQLEAAGYRLRRAS